MSKKIYRKLSLSLSHRCDLLFEINKNEADKFDVRLYGYDRITETVIDQNKLVLDFMDLIELRNGIDKIIKSYKEVIEVKGTKKGTKKGGKKC